MKRIILEHGRIVDPSQKLDLVGHLIVEEGRIARISQSLEEDLEADRIDCHGKIVCPGLIDLHVHLREPGQSAKETMETGTAAAAAGGFTTVVCMPNTNPTIDSPSTVAWIRERAAAKAKVRVEVAGALSKGIAGEELASIGSMVKAGVVALTDDGHCIQNHELMRRAVEYARMFDVAVLDHCQDYDLAGPGVMNEGYWSTVLGLPGWSSMAEEIIVMRNILLAEKLEHRIHCQHLTSGGSVPLIREARKRGVPISGEICPHHIALTDAEIQRFDSAYKMNPPLRTEKDIDQLIEGIADGTITVLASDHAPHCGYEKEVEFVNAPFGIIGLETELALFSTILIHQRRVIDWPRFVQMYTTGPANLLNLEAGTLQPGKPADITVIDPDREWIYDLPGSLSKARNSPFHGWELKGKAIATMVEGEVVWQAG